VETKTRGQFMKFRGRQIATRIQVGMVGHTLDGEGVLGRAAGLDGEEGHPALHPPEVAAAAPTAARMWIAEGMMGEHCLRHRKQGRSSTPPSPGRRRRDRARGRPQLPPAGPTEGVGGERTSPEGVPCPDAPMWRCDGRGPTSLVRQPVGRQLPDGGSRGAGSQTRPPPRGSDTPGQRLGCCASVMTEDCEPCCSVHREGCEC